MVVCFCVVRIDFPGFRMRQSPVCEELNNHFRITLYRTDIVVKPVSRWQEILMQQLSIQQELSTSEIAELWDVTTRTARNRLKKIVEIGVIKRIVTSSKDPYAVFVLEA